MENTCLTFWNAIVKSIRISCRQRNFLGVLKFRRNATVTLVAEMCSKSRRREGKSWVERILNEKRWSTFWTLLGKTLIHTLCLSPPDDSKSFDVKELVVTECPSQRLARSHTELSGDFVVCTNGEDHFVSCLGSDRSQKLHKLAPPSFVFLQDYGTLNRNAEEKKWLSLCATWTRIKISLGLSDYLPLGLVAMIFVMHHDPP